ncbi:MAG: Rieske 2Fe-2S domain-containing protein [Trueperaceae bacterium]|jgi:nitrite reductase/ring-hydroxylating ferredoxin subunit|nr:Rieske 2Fe-2S domain-containing protein [Truepera sp.]HRN17903.1 Rieske 2Fe-2S domain-containing protein [Trueperaceae bacterium]HRQ09425.1 Rieske 2Fe-2S domain-containing protein [Trueperaceae bacterium]
MTDPGAPADPERRELLKWLWRIPVIAVAVGGGLGLYEAIKVHFLKRSAAAEPVFAPRPPTRVAALTAFGNVWDAVAFELPSADPTVNGIPALVVRLPGPIPGDLAVESGVATVSAYLAGFSRVCTHQHCTVVLNTDPEAIAIGFNYNTDSPAFTCPCHLSVFDPMQAGKAVSGPAVLPLPRLRLEQEDGAVFATGIEND